MKLEKKRLLFYGLNIVIPIIIGLFIYLSFRRDTYVAAWMCKQFSIADWSDILRDGALKLFLKNFAADILWSYSLTFAITYTLANGTKKLYIAFIVCSCFEIVIETLQKVGFFHGTFDIYDIVFEIVTTGIALYIIKLSYREETNEKQSINH